MTTIADVAARAGVSKATASRALSGGDHVSPATRERVTRAARELAYVAHSSATSLATGRTRAVGVVMPTVNRWYFSQLLDGIQDALVARGLDLSLYSGADGTVARTRMLDHALSRRRFDGVIAVCIDPSAQELDRLLSLDRPLVTVGPVSAGSSAITLDDSAATRVATEHLIELGHRDIAFIGGHADPDHRSFGDHRRIAGYHDAMADADLADRIRVVHAVSTIPGGFDAAAHLLGDRRTRPTAVVGVCDETAIGTIIAARRLGIAVPTELSVVGVDDHEYADMFALTTMRQRPRAQGLEAVRLLHDRMRDADAPPERVVEASALVVRASTTAPRD